MTKHTGELADARHAYRALVLQICTDNLKHAQTGRLAEFANIKPIPPAPVSYEDKYSRAILMIDLSTDDEIELTAQMFNQLVLADWSQDDTTSN